MKTCSKCKVERTFDSFSRSNGKRKRKDGYHPICKVCHADYYQENRERIITQYAEYRRRPEITAEIKRQHKEYATRRYFYIRAANLKIRAKLKDQTATTAEISRLWKQQRGFCAVTGRRLNRDNAQLDHIVPLKKNGSDLISNLRWVHRDVNYAKRDLLDEDFYRLCWDVVRNQVSTPKRRNGNSQENSIGRQHTLDYQ